MLLSDEHSSQGMLMLSDTYRPQREGEKKDCPMDPYEIIHDKCTFVDSQTMKLQEAPDMVPVGELPRHLLVFGDRYVLLSCQACT